MVKTTNTIFFGFSLAISSLVQSLVNPVVWSTVFLFSTTVYLPKTWTARGYVGPWWTIKNLETTHHLVGRLSLMVMVSCIHDPILSVINFFNQLNKLIIMSLLINNKHFVFNLFLNWKMKNLWAPSRGSHRSHATRSIGHQLGVFLVGGCGVSPSKRPKRHVLMINFNF